MGLLNVRHGTKHKEGHKCVPDSEETTFIYVCGEKDCEEEICPLCGIHLRALVDLDGKPYSERYGIVDSYYCATCGAEALILGTAVHL